MGPGAIAHQRANFGHALRPFELAAVTNPAATHALLVYGRIFYTDVFGVDHKTDYCCG